MTLLLPEMAAQRGKHLSGGGPEGTKLRMEQRAGQRHSTSTSAAYFHMPVNSRFRQDAAVISPMVSAR